MVTDYIMKERTEKNSYQQYSSYKYRNNLNLSITKGATLQRKANELTKQLGDNPQKKP